MPSFSLSWLRRERDELVKDRAAFATCLDLLKRRMIDSNETEIPRTPLLHEWSGSRAVVGALEMALHSVERTLAEMDALIVQILDGEAIDLDKDGGSN